MSIPLSKKKVEAAIDKLPKGLQAKAKAMFHSRMELRHGSPAYARTHKNGVSDEQGKFAVELRKHDLSFREIEGVLKLHPNSGNGAYRLVQAFNGSKKKKAVTATAKVMRQPVLSARQFKALAKRFVQNNPKAAKSVFKEVVLVKKGRKMAAAV